MFHNHQSNIWWHHTCCAIGMGVIGMAISSDRVFKVASLLACNSEKIFGIKHDWFKNPIFYKISIPVITATVGFGSGWAVEKLLDLLFTWGLQNNLEQSGCLRGGQLTNGGEEMSMEIEFFKGSKSSIHAIKKDKEGVVELLSSSIIYDNDQNDNLIKADERGSYIFPGDGRQYIELDKGQDNVVISLCRSKISPAGEVLVISGLESNDRILIGCSKGVVHHSDFSFEYNPELSLTFAYVSQFFRGDTVTSLTDKKLQIRFAFAVEGDHTATLNKRIVTVEDKAGFASVSMEALPCFPNVFLGSDPEHLKGDICEALEGRSRCCDGVEYDVHPLGEVGGHDHSNCHHDH